MVLFVPTNWIPNQVEEFGTVVFDIEDFGTEGFVLLYCCKLTP